MKELKTSKKPKAFWCFQEVKEETIGIEWVEQVVLMFPLLILNCWKPLTIFTNCSILDFDLDGVKGGNIY